MLLGRSWALDVLMWGEDFGAKRAYGLGLVTKIVSRRVLVDAAEYAANRTASASSRAMLAIRQAVNLSLRHDWDEMAAYEEKSRQSIFAHPDAAEGVAATMKKRYPNFHDL